eukprot:1155780-Pelagomonas_calceolata.AAC.2
MPCKALIREQRCGKRCCLPATSLARQCMDAIKQALTLTCLVQCAAAGCLMPPPSSVGYTCSYTKDADLH